MSEHLKILIKAPNWVGDCVMATPAFGVLRQSFPDAQIDVLARPSVAAVLSGNPDLTEIYAADDRKLDRQIYLKLASVNYDAAVIFPNSFGSAWIPWMLHIPKRIGYARSGRSLLLTDRVKYVQREFQTATPCPLTRRSLTPERSRGAKPRHMVEYYAELAWAAAEALGCKKPSRDLRMKLEPGPEAVARVDALLERDELKNAVLVGINPGAAYGDAKRWPLDRLAQAADVLAHRPEVRIISTGSKFEIALNAQLQEATPTRIFRLGEELDLRGLIALMDRLHLLITNDSGAMHIAAARQTPIVAVFGPTDWVVTAPYKCRSRIVRNSPRCAPCFLRKCPVEHECMNDITAEMVIDASEQMLDAASGQGDRRPDAEDVSG